MISLNIDCQYKKNLRTQRGHRVYIENIVIEMVYISELVV